MCMCMYVCVLTLVWSQMVMKNYVPILGKTTD